MNHQQLNETFEQLTPRRKEVLRLVLAGESDQAIANNLNIKPATVRKYLERLYQAFDISKRVELVTLFAKYKPGFIGNSTTTQHQEVDIELPQTIPERKQDLGEAPDTVNFYGRTDEIETLKQWIVEDKCCIVALLGMGGLGKTALSVKLVQQLRLQFDYIIWRSLREAPKLETILEDMIKFLSNHQETDFNDSVGNRITRLIDYLRSSRCLLILDNFESILEDGARVGQYREDYKEYSTLIKRVGSSSHQSCLVLTSRTKPQEIAVLEGESLPIRSLLLQGLQQFEALKVLSDKGLRGSEDEILEVIRLYSGNPLALKIVSTFIKDLFNGDISEFLSQGLAPFVGIESLLSNQFKRLLKLEKEIMYWLAINREPVEFLELFEDIVEKPMFSELVESLENLKRRSLIETVDGARFTQQNVVMEYISGLLIRQISEEINSGQFHLFNTYSLIKATAKDYVRDCQTQLILKPIAKNITDIETKLVHPLKQRDRNIEIKGYAVGNILNLLRNFNYSLSGLDLSNLTVWQAYLRGANLRGVKFTGSDLNKSRFTQAFGTVLSLAYATTSIAMGDTKSKIRLTDKDGRELLTIEGHTNWVRSVAFSPDGKTLASGSDDKTLRVWNTTTGQCLKTLAGHKERVWSVAFSADGNILASGSEDRTVKLWDVRTGRCVRTLERHTSWVRSVTFSPDGKTLASGSSDKTVMLWDAKSGTLLKTLEGHTSRVRSVAFSPDGNTLASGGDDSTVMLWDVCDGKYLKTLEGHTARVRSVAFSPDGNTLASSSEDCKVILWNTHTGQRQQILSEHTARVWSVAFCDPNGKTLISSSDDRTVKLWDVSDGKCLKTLQGHTNWAWSVVFSPNSNILVSGNDDKTIKLWNVHTGQVETMGTHMNRIRSLAISPNGLIVASASDDQTIKLWDIHSGQLLKTLAGHADRVLAVAFSPDGCHLASGGDDKVVRIWNTSTGECLKTLAPHKNWIWSVSFSPDASILASGSEDRTVKLWHVPTGECLSILRGHTGWVRSVDFHPNGSILASGSEDETVKLWDIPTGKCLKTLKANGWVRSVAFSPDGRFLASAGEKPVVEIWDIYTADVYKTLPSDRERVWSVAFSADGKTLASSSEDGEIRLWNIETGEVKKLLRAPRLYEGMDITGVINLTESQINTLKILGASKNDR